jgi:hypothetical protein
MITYIALPNDSLEKIASDLKIENPIYLREFHNIHCAKHERFFGDLRTGQSLLLPFGNEIKELNKKLMKTEIAYITIRLKVKFPFQLIY